jgi:hypothetical protein
MGQLPFYGPNCCQLIRRDRDYLITVKSNPQVMGYQIELYCRPRPSGCTMIFGAAWAHGTKKFTLQQLVEANAKTSFASVSIDDDGDPVVRMSADISTGENNQRLEGILRIWQGQMVTTACFLKVIPSELCG